MTQRVHTVKGTFGVRVAVAAMLLLGACASGSGTTDAPRDGAGLGWATHSLTYEDGVPTAALTGRFVDVGGCLIITDATASVHVAALPADADFEAGVVTIGTESVRLGEPVTVGGGEVATVNSNVLSIPGACPKSNVVWVVTEIVGR